MQNKIKSIFSLMLFAGFATTLVTESRAALPTGYTGTPYKDSITNIPGRIQPERYDNGGKGVAWFDFSANDNKGAYAVRNPTGVDLAKIEGIDVVAPGDTTTIRNGEPLWGYVEPGDYVKLTVNVKQAGTYKIHIKCTVGIETKNPDIKISALDGTDSVSTGVIRLAYAAKFTGAWSYHNWQFQKNIAQLVLKEGVQVIRSEIIGYGPFNIQYFELEYAGVIGINQKAFDGNVNALQIEKITAQSNHIIHLSLNLPSQENVTVQLLDASGRLLAIQNYAHINAGKNLLSLNAGSFKQGLVFVKVQQGKFKKESKALLF